MTGRVLTTLRQGAELLAREVGQSPELRAARAVPLAGPDVGPHVPRVLVLSPRDWAVHVQWEALIGRALAAPGHRSGSRRAVAGSRPAIA